MLWKTTWLVLWMHLASLKEALEKYANSTFKRSPGIEHLPIASRRYQFAEISYRSKSSLLWTRSLGLREEGSDLDLWVRPRGIGSSWTRRNELSEETSKAEMQRKHKIQCHECWIKVFAAQNAGKALRRRNQNHPNPWLYYFGSFCSSPYSSECLTFPANTSLKFRLVIGLKLQISLKLAWTG